MKKVFNNIILSLIIIIMSCGVAMADPSTKAPGGGGGSSSQEELKCPPHVDGEKEYAEEEEWRYTEKGENGHTITKPYEIRCTKCNEVTKSGVDDEESEDHKFDSNGVCTKCKYKKEHVHQPKTESPLLSQIPGDSEYHNKVTTTKCADCEMVIDSKTEKEPHSGDTCDCGYKKVVTDCKHENFTTTETTEYKSLGEEGHNKIVVTNKLCANEKCGFVDSTKGEPIKEEHTLENGKCVCGYSEKTEQEKSEIETAIEFLKENEIMVGDENGNFNPDKAMTRAEYAKIVSDYVERIGNEKIEPDEDMYFLDVADDFWAKEYIAKAYNLDLLIGYGNGYFGSRESLTEAQAVTVIARTFGYFYESVEIVEEKTGSVYPRGYVLYAKDKKVVIENVVDDMPATRAKVALWLYRVYNAESL